MSESSDRGTNAPWPHWPRRDFLTTLSTAGVWAAVGVPKLRSGALASPGKTERPPTWTMAPSAAAMPELKGLAMRALDAAKAAGARYADVRLTYTRQRRAAPNFNENEELAVGVRALVDGAWGFASGPLWTPDAVAWLGREATIQAKIAPTDRQRVELGTVPVVTGDWQTPVKIDPFAVSVSEMHDWFVGMTEYMQQFIPANVIANWGLICTLDVLRQHQAFASTEGSYFTQTLTQTNARGEVGVNMREIVRWAPMWGDVEGGLEVAYDHDAEFRAWVPKAVDEVVAVLKLPVRPIDVGSFDVVFDAASMAECLAKSLGPAMQLDRAIGLEANAGGTSFLGPDPLKVLGTQVAAPTVTVTANRSTPRDLATVRWDTDGVSPRDVTLIDKGIFVDYETTREQASILSSYYQSHHQAVTSHGDATATSALEVSIQQTPNLTLHPGTESVRLFDMIASVTNGLLLRNGTIDMDFQLANGFGSFSECVRISRGRPASRIKNAGILFKTMQLWKNIQALGGPASQERWSAVSEKGEPSQTMPLTVRSVPAAIKEVNIIDVTRRA